jgi:hypothetical protein
MKGWIRRTWLGCVVALALGVPLAHADGGTITLTGAVVTPTCSINGGIADAISAGVASSQQHFGCSGAADTSFSAREPQAFRVSVEPLESSSLGTDRLISYFLGYVRAAVPGDTHMQLVTQAYD